MLSINDYAIDTLERREISFISERDLDSSATVFQLNQKLYCSGGVGYADYSIGPRASFYQVSLDGKYQDVSSMKAGRRLPALCGLDALLVVIGSHESYTGLDTA